MGQSFVTKNTCKLGHKDGEKVSQTIADIPKNRLALWLTSLFFFSPSLLSEIYGNACVQWAHGRATGVVTTARNLMRIGSIPYVYIYPREQARTLRFINKMNTPTFGVVRRRAIQDWNTDVTVRVACHIILNAINFLPNNKSQRPAERAESLYQGTTTLTKILSRKQLINNRCSYDKTVKYFYCY